MGASFLAELFDVFGDGVEHASGGGRRRQAEGETELPVEVAATEGGVVAVGEPEGVGWQGVAKRAQQGNASSARAEQAGRMAEVLAQMGVQALREG